MVEEAKPIRMRKAAKELNLSYSTLFRITKDSNSPFMPAIYWMRGSYFVDVRRFLEIARQQAKIRSGE